MDCIPHHKPVNYNDLGMDGMIEDEDDCPELVPIDNPPGPPAEQIPVTIITGYLGEIITDSLDWIMMEVIIS